MSPLTLTTGCVHSWVLIEHLSHFVFNIHTSVCMLLKGNNISTRSSDPKSKVNLITSSQVNSAPTCSLNIEAE